MSRRVAKKDRAEQAQSFSLILADLPEKLVTLVKSRRKVGWTLFQPALQCLPPKESASFDLISI